MKIQHPAQHRQQYDRQQPDELVARHSEFAAQHVNRGNEPGNSVEQQKQRGDRPDDKADAGIRKLIVRTDSDQLKTG